MQLFACALVLFIPVFAQEPSGISAAKGLLAAPDGPARAEAFLDEFIIKNPDDPAALTMLALLKFSHLRNSPEALISEAQPIIERALGIRQRDPATTPSDLALALELEAEALRRTGRAAEASPLAAQALTIRREILRGMTEPFPAESVYRVGQGVSAPMVIQKADPEYSEDARIGKFSGTVLLSIVIDPNGVARDISLTRSLGFGLDEKALAAVAQWHFKPGMMNGQSVPVSAQIEINFRLL